MALGSWLQQLKRRFQRPVRRRQALARPKPVAHVIEVLEDRSYLSVSSLFVAGELAVTSDANDSIRVGEAGGTVLVEQTAPGGVFVPLLDLPRIPVGSLLSMIIDGGDEGNFIDLSGLNPATFTALSSIQVVAGDGNDSILGSPFGDSIFASDGADTVLGFAGNDTVNGADGDDIIDGGADDDTLDGEDGNDSLIGNFGNDRLVGGDGLDSLSGNEGDDDIDSGAGNDNLLGNTGNDTLNGGLGHDTLVGDEGDDCILGGAGLDALFGDATDQQLLRGLTVAPGLDTLLGQGGDDTLIGGGEADRLDGGAGDDRVLSTFLVLTPPPLPEPEPLPSAEDSGGGVDLGSLEHTLTNGPGDGSLTIAVDGTGAFGRFSNLTSLPNETGATYDPVGETPSATTTFESSLYFRNNSVAPSGPRQTLREVAGANVGTIRELPTEANSTFRIGNLSFELTQTVTDIVDPFGGRSGSLLTQSYVITNTDVFSLDFELVRYLDGELRFDGTIADGGGRLVTLGGDEVLLQTDTAGSVTSNTTFVGITSRGGTAPATNRFEINAFPGLRGRIRNGADLSGTVLGDADNDRFVDPGNESDAGLVLRNTFSMASGSTVSYTTHTVFGSGTPSDVAQVPRPAGAPPDDAVGDTLIGGVGRDTLVAGNGNDHLDGDEDADQLLGRGGDDTVLGGGGSDTVTGGKGADAVDAQAGEDVVRGDAPSLVVNDLTVHEGSSGTSTVAVFTVALDESSPDDITVNFRTEDGTTLEVNGVELARPARLLDSDYQRTSGTITIPAGQLAASITVTVNGDDFAELDERFFLRLFNPLPADTNLLDNEGVGTILTNRRTDVIARVSVGDVLAGEGDSPLTPPSPRVVQFTVSLSDPSPRDVAVTFMTADDITGQFPATSTPGQFNDYTPTSGVLIIPAGQVSRTINVDVNPDFFVEFEDETFLVNLSVSDSNVRLVDGQAVGTIVDDDILAPVNGLFTIPDDGSNQIVLVDPETLDEVIQPDGTQARFNAPPDFRVAPPRPPILLDTTGANGLAFDAQSQSLFLVVYTPVFPGQPFRHTVYQIDVPNSLFIQPATAFLRAGITVIDRPVLSGMALLPSSTGLFTPAVHIFDLTAQSVRVYDPFPAGATNPATTNIINLPAVGTIDPNRPVRLFDFYRDGLASIEDPNGNHRLLVLNENFLQNVVIDGVVVPLVPNVDVVEISNIGLNQIPQVVSVFSVLYEEIGRVQVQDLNLPVITRRPSLASTTPADIRALGITRQIAGQPGEQVYVGIANSDSPFAPELGGSLPGVATFNRDGSGFKMEYSASESSSASATSSRSLDIVDFGADSRVDPQFTIFGAQATSTTVLVATAPGPRGEAPITLTTGTADGSLTVGVDRFGAFGASVPGPFYGNDPQRDAVFDPVGASSAAGTTVESAVAVRLSTSGNPRSFLSFGQIGSPVDPPNRGETTVIDPQDPTDALEPENAPTILERSPSDVTTLFTLTDAPLLEFVLNQAVSPVFDVNGRQSGSVLRQAYTVTNTGSSPQVLELVRYLDANIGPSVGNVGGRLVDRRNTTDLTDDREFLVVASLPAPSSPVPNYLAITSFVDSAPSQGGSDIDVPSPVFPDASDQLLGGLARQIADGFSIADGVCAGFGGGDCDAAGVLDLTPPTSVVDDNFSFDFAVAQRTVLNLSPGGSATYVTLTVFGSGLPEGILSSSGTPELSGQFADPAPADTLNGSDGNDSLQGGAGNDVLNGGNSSDTVEGGHGHDSALGGAGHDSIAGGSGDDTLVGQGGNDRIHGGNDDDQIVWRGEGDGDDTLDGGIGFDQLDVRGGPESETFTVTQTILLSPSGSSVVGTNLLVTEGADVITVVNNSVRQVRVDGRSGNDTIRVSDLDRLSSLELTLLGGADGDLIDATGAAIGNVRLLIDGGPATDRLIGSSGPESIVGAEGNDILFGGLGRDTIQGGDDEDWIVGEGGNDVLLGDNGNDTLSGGDDDDSLLGGDDHDRLIGDAGHDTLRGQNGDDNLNGALGNDVLFGDTGIDTLFGGGGHDTLDGGRNNDFLFGNSGNDRLRGDHGNDSLVGSTGDDTLDGGDGNDTLLGGDGHDALLGGNGNDLLDASLGDDTLLGGDGEDTLLGGAGQDIALGEDGDDQVNGQGGSRDTLAGGEGNDIITGLASEIDEAFVLSAQILAALNAR